MSNDQRKTIVVLGAGFGGLHCAISIGKKLKRLGLTSNYRVLLVDQNDYHTYTPTLYEAATTSEETATQLELKRIITFPVRESISGLPIEFVKTRVSEIDVLGGDIHTDTGTMIKFDYLVLALGSQTNYFGIPGLQEKSLPLKSFLDALRIRERLVSLSDDPDQKRLRVVVGGGGSTGVEIAGEVKLWLRAIEKACEVSVSIVEGGPTVLGPFGPRIILKAQKRLEKLGVKLWTNERIQSVTDSTVHLASGTDLPYDVLIWTGGVMPNQLMSRLKVKQEEHSKRVLAGSDMSCLPEKTDLKFYGSIYGLGDAVCFIDPKSGRPVPGVARAAISQANVVSHNIIEEIKVKERLAPAAVMKEYQPMNYPYVIPIGGKYAIAKMGPVVITGFLGWFIKAGVEINYLVSVLPLPKAIATWLKGLLIFIQNERLG